LARRRGKDNWDSNCFYWVENPFFGFDYLERGDYRVSLWFSFNRRGVPKGKEEWERFLTQLAKEIAIGNWYIQK